MSYTGRLQYKGKRDKVARETKRQQQQLRELVAEAKAQGYSLEETKGLILNAMGANAQFNREHARV